MCGIVGYCGSQAAKDILINGLERLEYRGYDSAGISLFDSVKNDFFTQRSVGKVQVLKDKVATLEEQLHQGIAHTRWATHGVPSEINAHPHRAGEIILVHNGILENHAELKQKLINEGVEFQSQTDTEVFAKRLEYNLVKSKFSSISSEEEKKSQVLKAFQKTLQESEGQFAVLFMVQSLPGYLFSVQFGAPLVVSHTDSGVFVASDLQALLSYGNQLSFPALGTLVVSNEKSSTFYDYRDLKKIEVKVETINWSADKVEKEGYEHFMLKEIFEQPRVVADTLSGRLPESELSGFVWDFPQAHEALWKNIDRLYLVACGTAYYAAMTAKYYFEKWARIPVDVDLASEFRYREPVLEPGTALGVISQSGETADTLAALRLANEKGLTTFCVCNVPNSTIMRESQFQYITKAGPEIGVASTKAFTTQLTVLCALALDVARLRMRQIDSWDTVRNSLARLPHDMESILNKAEEIKAMGAGLKKDKTILFVGRGMMFPIAMEGALKLKEITYYHAEGYAAGELKHGPLALVDENLTAIVLGPRDGLLKKTLSNLEEIKSRNGKIIGIGEPNDQEFKSLCQGYIEIPKCDWSIAPMLYVLPLQLLAYGLAHCLDRDIDKPRNLAKSVTVE